MKPQQLNEVEGEKRPAPAPKPRILKEVIGDRDDETLTEDKGPSLLLEG